MRGEDATIAVYFWLHLLLALRLMVHAYKHEVLGLVGYIGLLCTKSTTDEFPESCAQLSKAV
jgi:hypothetical protein